MHEAGVALGDVMNPLQDLLIGDLRRVDLLEEGISPRALRYALIAVHYRQGLEYTPDELVDSAGVVWRKHAAPSPDADQVAVLEAFLEARVAGEGAEQYLGSGLSRDDRVPLLYATTSGAG